MRPLTAKLDQLDLLHLAHIDIAYSIVFFGVSNEDVSTLYRLHQKHYKHDFLDSVFRFIVRKPSKKTSDSNIIWEELRSLMYKIVFESDRNRLSAQKRYNELILIKPKSFIKYYGGHQYKLGHYFRHLYQQVKYINNLRLYDYADKYDMLKTLRAQLSSPEQYVIFFNSVSFVGRAWEYESIMLNNDTNHYFISKYNLIKNLPELTLLVDNPSILPINLRHFYPLVSFEFSGQPTERPEFMIGLN